jgi:hypothetical protein
MLPASLLKTFTFRYIHKVQGPQVYPPALCSLQPEKGSTCHKEQGKTEGKPNLYQTIPAIGRKQ